MRMKNKNRNKRTILVFAHWWWCCAAIFVAHSATAAVVDVPGLTPPQQSAAVAMQAIFDTLDARLQNQEVLTDPELELYSEARTFVHTSNEILGNGGPTSSSLELDAEGFGFALQWLAHEEFNTQGKISGEIAGTQLANIASRLEALRSGVRGLSVNGYTNDTPLIARYPAYLFGASGGGAGDGALLDGRLSGFMTASFSFGNRDPSENEDAFDYDSLGVTVGADYRFSDSWIAGVALGYSDLTADFDSALSVVEGEIVSQSTSFTFYATWYSGDFFADATVGAGFAGFDSTRRISYPSNNPLVPGANETALSDTNSQRFSTTLRTGYNLVFDAATLTAQLDLAWVDVVIDGYQERNAVEFNLDIGEQQLQLITAGAGAQASYAVSLSSGVLLPQIGLTWIQEFEDAPRPVSARFLDDTTNSFFIVESDAPDTSYGIASADLSYVSAGGIQAFVTYQTPVALEKLKAHSIGGGLRIEF
jgi:uncharacterized protein YhjY with autotransporter beta-barrel domain